MTFNSAGIKDQYIARMEGVVWKRKYAGGNKNEMDLFVNLLLKLKKMF